MVLKVSLTSKMSNLIATLWNQRLLYNFVDAHKERIHLNHISEFSDP